jgi:hypothetical protein
MGYDIDNNILESHGWSRVHILAQKTLYDKMLSKIRRQVGQLGQLKNSDREKIGIQIPGW